MRTAFNVDGRLGAVESLDQRVPGDVEPQILRFVNDARAVFEADNMDGTAAIMRIREITFDLGNRLSDTGIEDVAADGGQICIEA